MPTTRIKGSLYTKIQNKIATVEFAHPASNSFPLELLNRLTQKLNELSEDANVNVIILKSESDQTFCAGASFNELMDIATIEEGKTFFSGFANVINAMRRCKKLIIARVQGKAVGGGVGLIAASDYALATENAAIKLSEIAIGIGPFLIEPAITRKIGKAAFSELTLTAHQWKNAYWAKEKGLYAKVFDTIKNLDREVHHLAQKLASYNPDALLNIKKIFWENTENWSTLLKERAKISGELVLSEFTKDALAKFKK